MNAHPFVREMPLVLYHRRTVHDFTDELVPDDRIRDWLDAAVYVPNHHLTQPWRFYVLDAATQERLADLAAQLAADKHADPDRAARAAEHTRREWRLAPRVLAVVQVGATLRDPVGRDEDYAACCLATYNILLAAWADGYGTHWSTGRLARAPEAHALLGLDAPDRIVAWIRVGRPARVPTVNRRPARDVTIWLSASDSPP